MRVEDKTSRKSTGIGYLKPKQRGECHHRLGDRDSIDASLRASPRITEDREIRHAP